MDKTINKDIIRLINDWNPAEIYPLLEVEYFSEIKRIINFINTSERISIVKLANQIDKIFIHSFGTFVYHSDMNKCKEIAKEILNATQN